MKDPIHDRPVRFRAPGQIVDAAREHVAAAGMTVPEYLRASLRAAARGNITQQEYRDD